MKRPMTMTLIGWFLVGIAAISFVLSWKQGEGSLLQIANYFLGFIILGGSGVAVLRGKTFGRWVFACWAITGPIFSALAAFNLEHLTFSGFSVASFLIALVICYLLFNSEATKYFTKKNQSRELKRPLSVFVISWWIIIFSFTISLRCAVSSHAYNTDFGLGHYFLIAVILGSLTNLWASLMILKGNRWGRLVFISQSVLGIVPAYMMDHNIDHPIKGLFPSYVIIFGIVNWILFSTSANNFFRRSSITGHIPAESLHPVRNIDPLALK